MSAILPLSFIAGSARFDHSQPGWTFLDPGAADDGRRRVAGRVDFERPFDGAPVVHLGVTGFDIDNRANARLEVAVTSIDAKGFELELRTWYDSRLWSVDLGWIAIGH